MQAERSARRSYGSGSLFTVTDARGHDKWVGQWRVGDRLVKQRLGWVRTSARPDGLTRVQADRELRRRMTAEAMTAPPTEKVTVELAGDRYLAHLGGLGRKKSTLMDYESALRVHLGPYFGTTSLDRIASHDVERFIRVKAAAGKRPKSIRNYVGVLHAIFVFAEKRGWATVNPCKLAEKPRVEQTEDIRFLETEQVEALIGAVPDDLWGATERVLYRAAAMTGLRQGEILALRWRDVDWLAQRVRVRRNFVRGEYGTPKSRRSSRSVPMADQVAAELERHFQRSAYQGDDELVFAHPQTGTPLDRSKLLKRFKRAARAAQLGDVRFHDLRHTFGTRMAGAGVPMRTLQEWMGHRDAKTTEIYADYAPSAHEAEFVERAFGSGAPRVPVRTVGVAL